MQALVAGIPYSTIGRKKPEVYEELVQTALYAWFNALGMSVLTEVHSIRGRADVVIDFPNVVCVFELKVGKREYSAGDALAQIKEKGYAAPHLGKGKRVLAIGVSVDTREETRGALEWESEEMQ